MFGTVFDPYCELGVLTSRFEASRMQEYIRSKMYLLLLTLLSLPKWHLARAPPESRHRQPTRTTLKSGRSVTQRV